MTGNFRCVTDNEGRKQRAVQNQWNSSCEFLNVNLLYLPQKVLKNLIHWLCYTKTLYKACHYCFCKENYFAYTEIDAKWKISSFVFSICSPILFFCVSVTMRNNRIINILYVAQSLQAGMFDSDCWRKLFLNSEQTLLVLKRLDTSIFFTQILHSSCVFLFFFFFKDYLLTVLKQAKFPPAASLSSALRL